MPENSPIVRRAIGRVAARVGASALLALSALANSSPGQSSNPKDSLIVHHPSKSAVLSRGGSRSEVLAGATARVGMGKAVSVVIDSTNSALYDCTLDQTAIAVPELDSLKTFLSALSPYLPVLGQLLVGARGKDDVAFKGKLQPLRDALARLDSLIHGPRGLDAVHARTVGALDRMRRHQSTIVATDTLDLHSWLGDLCNEVDGRCASLTIPADINTILETIGTNRVSLVANRLSLEDEKRTLTRERMPLSWEVDSLNQLILAATRDSEKVALRAQLKPILDRNLEKTHKLAGVDTSLSWIKIVVDAADKALLEADKVLAVAYAVDAQAIRTVNAKSTIACGLVRVEWNSGKAATVKVAPGTAPEVARIASRPILEFKANIQPDWWIRPALGLSFLAARDAEYPGLGTEASGAKFKIVNKGSQDARFTYGLTLGLTYPWFDGREGSGFAIWLPDLTINPTADVKAMGAGVGISYRLIKVGFGKLWSKHSVLDGQSVGQELSTAAELALRNGYGRPKTYVSLSLIGLPPFIR